MTGRAGRESSDSMAGQGRWLVLLVLTSLIMLNYLDRFVIAILLQPIKVEMGLSDGQIGLLTGAAFAILYAGMALPIARLAEQKNRAIILALSVVVWSVGAAACGLAGSFLALLLARAFVGAGEAGAMAPSHSIIADIFPVKQRGTAMALLTTGGAIGAACSPLLGGMLLTLFDWRGAFFVLGLAGAPLALVVVLIVRDPPRGFSDGLSPEISSSETQSIGPSLRTLFSKASFGWITAGLSIMALGHYGLLLWTPSLLMRSFGWTATATGVAITLYQGLPALAGSLFGGLLADMLYRRDRRWLTRIPMLSALIAGPFVVFFATVKSPEMALFALIIPSLATGLYLAPCYAAFQNLTPAHLRTTAAAIAVVCVTIVGAGLGPLLIGGISDVLSTHFGAQGLRYSMLSPAPVFLGAAAMFTRASRDLVFDLDRVV